MKLLLAAMLVSSVLCHPIAETGIDPSVDYGNINHLLDGILFKVNRNLPDYIEIGDLGGPFDFTDCIFLGTANGIHRDGDATLFTTGNVAQFNSALRMTEVGINCNFHYAALSLDGTADVSTETVHMTAGIGLLEQHGQHPYLTEFVVNDMDAFKTDIDGLPPGMDWLAKEIADLILSKAEDAITSVIENQVRDIFQEVLDTIIVP